MKNLQQNLEYKENEEYINCVVEFINWLKKNEQIIRNQFENKGMMRLYIPVGEETRLFLTELKELYCRINFEFPFYEFSFNVSTGEYSFLNLFSNLYSIVSRDKNAINVYDYQKLEVEKKGILLIFDEADLSMHPRWQRMYMKWLIDFCEQLFKNISIKIIITTHSPILLSDFPANSILYVGKDEKGKVYYDRERKETFGCNIHSLYLNAFLLEECGTMGAFAEEKINEIADSLLQKAIDEKEYDKKEKLIEYIGEGLIKKKLKEILNRNRKGKISQISDTENTFINDTLLKLKEQRIYMDQLIRELEEKIND